MQEAETVSPVDRNQQQAGCREEEQCLSYLLPLSRSATPPQISTLANLFSVTTATIEPFPCAWQCARCLDPFNLQNIPRRQVKKLRFRGRGGQVPAGPQRLSGRAGTDSRQPGGPAHTQTHCLLPSRASHWLSKAGEQSEQTGLQWL